MLTYSENLPQRANKEYYPMVKYILLVNWTDQGIRNIKDSAKRLDAGRTLAKQHGCVLENFFMTMGGFDNVAVVDAPDDESLAKYVEESTRSGIRSRPARFEIS